jgi:hypothetical protein
VKWVLIKYGGMGHRYVLFRTDPGLALLNNVNTLFIPLNIENF